MIPTPESLTSRTASRQSELWTAPYAYLPEREVLSGLVGRSFSLLDVGAAGGGLLDAVSDLADRRSALDIVRFERLTLSKSGEFIEGFLDQPRLQWSKRPYDVVTAFDILEHLYSPPQAFVNLAELVRPGGYVLLETGNADAIPAAERWYYLSLFEHHIAWTPAALNAAALRAGFEVVSVVEKAHKASNAKPGRTSSLKHLAYSVNPGLYHALQRACGLDGAIPPKPGLLDHFQAVLQRVGA